MQISCKLGSWKIIKVYLETTHHIIRCGNQIDVRWKIKTTPGRASNYAMQEKWKTIHRYWSQLLCFVVRDCEDGKFMDYVWLYLSTWWTSARRIFIYFVCFDQVLAVVDTLNVVMLTLYNACVTHNNSVYGNCMKFQSTSHTVVFTSRVCGRGNVFVVSVCVCLFGL